VKPASFPCRRTLSRRRAQSFVKRPIDCPSCGRFTRSQDAVVEGCPCTNGNRRRIPCPAARDAWAGIFDNRFPLGRIQGLRRCWRCFDFTIQPIQPQFINSFNPPRRSVGQRRRCSLASCDRGCRTRVDQGVTVCRVRIPENRQPCGGGIRAAPKAWRRNDDRWPDIPLTISCVLKTRRRTSRGTDLRGWAARDRVERCPSNSVNNGPQRVCPDLIAFTRSFSFVDRHAVNTLHRVWRVVDWMLRVRKSSFHRPRLQLFGLTLLISKQHEVVHFARSRN